MNNIKIGPTWKQALEPEFLKPYWEALTTNVRGQYQTKQVYPPAKNIFQEIRNDLGITPLPSGDLSHWATQGVLMLNSVLTVLANSPASHAGIGWEKFTDAVIETLNAKCTHIVYLLWGKYAQSKGAVINKDQNLVLTSGHPSPYSVSLFFGKHHFSQCNKYLEENGLTPIDWR